MERFKQRVTGARKFFIKIIGKFEEDRNNIFIALTEKKGVMPVCLDALQRCLVYKNFRRDITCESLRKVIDHFNFLAEKRCNLATNSILQELCCYPDLAKRLYVEADEMEFKDDVVKDQIETFCESFGIDLSLSDSDSDCSESIDQGQAAPANVPRRHCRTLRSSDDCSSLIEFIEKTIAYYADRPVTFIPPLFYQELYQ